jgi:hypothetical protein
MGNVTYVATDSLFPPHFAGQTISFDIDFQEARQSRAIEKSVQRSQGGSVEVLKNRTDVTWEITFEPVNGSKLRHLREFIASTEGGEQFTIDPYGTASAPIAVKRVDDGTNEEPFMRNGSDATDYFVVSITVLEV